MLYFHWCTRLLIFTYPTLLIFFKTHTAESEAWCLSTDVPGEFYGGGEGPYLSVQWPCVFSGENRILESTGMKPSETHTHTKGSDLLARAE